MNIQQNQHQNGLKAFIQCTFANCYTEPINNRGLCIRSYDRKFLLNACRANFNGSKEPALTDAKYKEFLGLIYPITNAQIAELTLNFCIDEKGMIWREARLLYCDRRMTGWFMERDIWHSLKEGKPNDQDNGYIGHEDTVNPDNGDNGNNDDNGNGTDKKSNSWLGWLTAGLGLLSMLK